MKSLQTRLRRLEARYGPTAPLPWETPGWERLSEAEQLREVERYVAAYPDSTLARQWRAIAALSDVELEAYVANLTAQLGVTPCAAGLSGTPGGPTALAHVTGSYDSAQWQLRRRGGGRRSHRYK
jgi:hypothetical protein